MRNSMKKIIAFYALSSSAVFAMEAMDDQDLGNVDAQDGVTIVQSINGQTTIDSISYLDDDGDGEAHTAAAGIYLSDISIDTSSFQLDIDVVSETDGDFLNINISNIVQGDLWVRDIALGATQSSVGAISITDYNYDTNGSYNIKIGNFDPDGDDSTDNSYSAIIYNLDFASSSYKYTFVDEAEFDSNGNLIDGFLMSYDVQFTNFKTEDTTVSLDPTLSGDGKPWAKLSLGSITGAADFNDITFQQVGGAPTVMGSAGFSGIQIQDNSFIAISAH